MHYWAVYPKSAGLQSCRIEKALTAIEAIRIAFDIRPERGRWLAKDMGSRLSVIQSDRQRLALLNDPSNWLDPLQ